ncbi:LSU ribosomal protein L14E [Gottschalkia purinilytica]|uniref:LSU ribosomal protein L14E n=1 Tax=Gottschalkia purinilytica TaxID=1503 RepID=A0A0L0W9C8_GOTPU|nr:KOW domain-containing RNA-binding protein [Gottschalkia purinilytica]KNF08042.1 LSU ribosomal protein L14E [Gottschalkia purinilytica]
METTNDINIGQVVRSKAGRDKGKVFIINSIIDEQYVSIVDGKYRKLSNPKKKKIRHLVIYNSILKDFKDKLENNEKINNAYVRKILEPFNKEI